MASSLHAYSRPKISKINPNSISNPRISHLKLSYHYPTKTQSLKSSKFRKRLYIYSPNSAYLDHTLIPNAHNHNEIIEINQIYQKKWVDIIRSVLPRGSWWKLSDNYSLPASAKPVTVMQALAIMWRLVADDKWVLYTAFAALTVAALSEISIPSILAASVFSAQRGETMVFYRNAQLLALLCLTSGICSGLRSGCFAIANMTLVKRLRETLYGALLLQDISFFDIEAVGDLTSRLGMDCQRLSNTIGNDLHLIARNTLQGTGALISLLTFSWPLALSTLVICSVLSAIFLVYGQYQKKTAKIGQDFTASANEVAQETLSLMRTVRAYGTEREELARFAQWQEKITSIAWREKAAYGLWNLSFNSLYRSTQVLAVLLGGMSIIAGHASAEQLTKYVFYCEWLIYAAWRVQDNMSSLLQSVGACEKVFQLMNLLPCDQFSSKGGKLKRLMGRIEFVNVSFHHPSRETVLVLQNVNISIEANTVVAIVGISGSGKSTLVNLLLRLYEPTIGQILIDNFPLQELDIRWLRGKIGFVGQEPHLFHMDIKSNISYGCCRSVGREHIEWAAKQAYADEFISSLPDGYETIVDDNLLSGGQKQRIAIARAILRDPAILILDEATSALDAESEYYVKELLYSFKSDFKTRRTIIIIAHRLSTIQAADSIVVMDGGRIVETGKHEDLLRKDGLYAQLTRIQTDALVQSSS